MSGATGGTLTDSVIIAALISGVMSGIFLIANTIITFSLERRFDREEDEWKRRGDPSSDTEGEEMVTSRDSNRRRGFARGLYRASHLRIRRDTKGEEAERD